MEHDNLNQSFSWYELQQDLGCLISFLYEVTTCVATDQVAGSNFVRIFNSKLLSMPDGWRIAKLLRELDERWACELRALGITLSCPKTD